MVGTLVRLIIAAFVLIIVGLLVPGFRTGGFFGAMLASAVVAFLGHLPRAAFGHRFSPQGQGLACFFVSALTIYLAQFVVPGFQVSLAGTLLAALIIGIIDAFVPAELR